MIGRRALTALLMIASAAPALAQEKKPPYWASIASGEAMMRTGPGRNYPGTWLYKRRDLPVRVLKLYPNWRLIEDPDGARGWMLVTLLSDRRSAIVKKASRVRSAPTRLMAPGSAISPKPARSGASIIARAAGARSSSESARAM